LWDGGNVAYYDSMKTVLTTEEFASCFPATPSAEHFGDMFEFWLGMLDLAVQFPTMFSGWGNRTTAWQDWKNPSGYSQAHADT